MTSPSFDIWQVVDVLENCVDGDVRKGLGCVLPRRPSLGKALEGLTLEQRATSYLNPKQESFFSLLRQKRSLMDALHQWSGISSRDPIIHSDQRLQNCTHSSSLDLLASKLHDAHSAAMNVVRGQEVPLSQLVLDWEVAQEISEGVEQVMVQRSPELLGELPVEGNAQLAGGGKASASMTRGKPLLHELFPSKTEVHTDYSWKQLAQMCIELRRHFDISVTYSTSVRGRTHNLPAHEVFNSLLVMRQESLPAEIRTLETAHGSVDFDTPPAKRHKCSLGDQAFKGAGQLTGPCIGEASSKDEPSKPAPGNNSRKSANPLNGLTSRITALWEKFMDHTIEQISHAMLMALLDCPDMCVQMRVLIEDAEADYEVLRLKNMEPIAKLQPQNDCPQRWYEEQVADPREGWPRKSANPLDGLTSCIFALWKEVMDHTPEETCHVMLMMLLDRPEMCVQMRSFIDSAQADWSDFCARKRASIDELQNQIKCPQRGSGEQVLHATGSVPPPRLGTRQPRHYCFCDLQGVYGLLKVLCQPSPSFFLVRVCYRSLCEIGIDDHAQVHPEVVSSLEKHIAELAQLISKEMGPEFMTAETPSDETVSAADAEEDFVEEPLKAGVNITPDLTYVISCFVSNNVFHIYRYAHVCVCSYFSLRSPISFCCRGSCFVCSETAN